MQSSSKTLLFVDNRAEYFVSHRLELAKAARSAGYDVHVSTLTAGDSQPIQDAGLTYHSIARGRRSGRLLEEARLIGRLRRLYATVRPALIHHVTLRAILYGGLLARQMRIPAVVNSVTGLGYLFSTDGVSARTIQAMIGLVFRYCSARDRVVTIFQNTDDMALFVEKRWAKRDQAVLIRGSGVDLKVFPYHELADASRPLVLFPSRLLMHKGISEFVGAAQRLKNDFPNVSFAVAGDLDPDNPASLSEETLRRWTEQGNVEFWGYCDNMSTAYGQATIVCLPSYYREGVPKALIEAAATGRAIVTTNMPGCRELVVDGVNGLLVPPRDIDALTSALRALLNDLPRCREMGAEGRRVVEAGYSLSDVTTHTVALYERLLGSEKAGDNQHPVG